MYRIIICASAGALFIASQAIAQEKVSFPSTDADLKGGTPTTITGYLYKPTGSGPFAAVVGMHGGDGLFKKGKINPLHGQWGQILADKGYLVLLVDSFQPRGQGEEVDYSNLNILPEREMPRDAFGAMNYLRSRADVRPDSHGAVIWWCRDAVHDSQWCVTQRCERFPSCDRVLSWLYKN